MQEPYLGDVIAETWTDHQTATDGHTTSRGRVVGVLPYRYEDCDHYGCKTVVVIDPEDREQVERLANCIRAAIGMTTLPSRTELERGLREFANPKPPIEEPTGLGAVVEDTEGSRWVRVATGPVRTVLWRRDGFTFREFAGIDAVRVLSEGVQP